MCAVAGLFGGIMLLTTAQIGISERVVLYPLPTWMAVTGLVVLLALLRKVIAKRRVVANPDPVIEEPALERELVGAGA